MHTSAIVACFPALLTVVAFAQSPAPRSVTVGEWTITWTYDAAQATHRDGRVVVMWAQPKEEGCDISASGELLSVVGTIVSFEKGVGGYCRGSAHPFAQRTFEVIDLSRSHDPFATVTLYDFFSKVQVDRALDNDPFLKKNEKDRDSNCMFDLEGFERSFAFHHLQGDKVAVRVGLTHGCEAARGNLTQLGLLLKPNADFLVELQAAETAGTLMNRLVTK